MMEELEQEEYIEACLEQLWVDEIDEEINASGKGLFYVFCLS